MLKFNKKLIKDIINFQHLNTSYVKVQLTPKTDNRYYLLYLNTSYVKVQLAFALKIWFTVPYLNTSYVKVQLVIDGSSKDFT